MAVALLVLNGGSSSVKFSAFTDDESPRPLVRGQIARVAGRWRLVARDATKVITNEEWHPGARAVSAADVVEYVFAALVARHTRRVAFVA